MSGGYLLFLAIGRLLIFLANKFISQNEMGIKFLNRLLSCVLCSGVWCYTILSFLTGYSVFGDWIPYVPVLSEFITGCASAYLVYMVEQGWKATNEVIVI